jgi:hypothetical protein
VDSKHSDRQTDGQAERQTDKDSKTKVEKALVVATRQLKVEEHEEDLYCMAKDCSNNNNNNWQTGLT